MDAQPATATKVIGGVTIGLAFAGMLWWTWGTWPDVLVDFGRELYAPWQLSQGKVLYRDLAWLNGPLSPYVNSVWFRLLGVGFRSLVFGNILLVLAFTWLIFRLACLVGNRLSGTLAALTFIAMFGFSVSNYNFLSPYSHDLTHGAFVSFASLACFAAYLRFGSRRAIAGTGFLLGLAFLTKAEVFIALASALAIGIFAAIRVHVIPCGRRGRAVGYLVGASLAPIVLTWLLFLTVLSGGDAWVATTGAWHYVLNKGVASLVFYQRMAGVSDTAGSLRAILVSALAFGVFFGIGAIAAVVTPKRDADRRVWMAVTFAVGVLLLGVGTRFVPWIEAARPLPLFMMVLGGLIARGIARRSSILFLRDHVNVLRLTFVTFALVLLGRMLLNVSFYGYGFVLALPATIVLLVALVDWIPARLSAAGWAGGVFRALSLAAWFVLMMVHLGSVSAYLAHKTEAVASEADRFLSDARASVVNAVVREIGVRLGADQTLLVLPEGVMLNYLARRVNPTPYVNFMPVELAAFGESQIVAALARRPPDYVAMVHKDTSEYGFHFFGRDYGQSLQVWISSHYEPVQTWGEVPLQGERFGISLLARIPGKPLR